MWHYVVHTHIHTYLHSTRVEASKGAKGENETMIPLFPAVIFIIISFLSYTI